MAMCYRDCFDAPATYCGISLHGTAVMTSIYPWGPRRQYFVAGLSDADASMGLFSLEPVHINTTKVVMQSIYRYSRY